MPTAVATPAPECHQTAIHEKTASRAHIPLVRFAKAKFAFAACVLTVLVIVSSNMEGRTAGEKPVMSREPSKPLTPASFYAPIFAAVMLLGAFAFQAREAVGPAPECHQTAIHEKTASRAHISLVRFPKAKLAFAACVLTVLVIVSSNMEGRKAGEKPVMGREPPKPLTPAAPVGADGEVVRKPLIRKEPKLTVPGVSLTSEIAEVTDADAVDAPVPVAVIEAKQRRSYYAPIFAAVMLLGAFAFQAREAVGQVLNMPIAKDYLDIKKK